MIAFFFALFSLFASSALCLGWGRRSRESWKCGWNWPLCKSFPPVTSFSH